MANLTENHGGPVTTEYLLTGNIARALIARHIDGVVVECKYREMVGPFAALRPGPDFRGARADIAVTSRALPRRKSWQAAYPRLTATLAKQCSGCSRRGLRYVHNGARLTYAVVNGNLQSRKAGFDFQCRGPRCFGRLE